MAFDPSTAKEFDPSTATAVDGGFDPSSAQEVPKSEAANYLSKVGRTAIGAGEAGLQAITGGAAFLRGSLIRARNEFDSSLSPQEKEDLTKQAIESNTYAPRTPEGEAMGDAVGEFANQILMPMTGIHLGPIRVPKRKPKGVDFGKLDEAGPPVEPVVPTKSFDPSTAKQLDLPLEHTEQQYAESRARDKTPGQGDLFQNESMDTVPPGNAPPEVPRTNNYPPDSVFAQQQAYRDAQAALEARQAAMTQDVTRQTGLDMGAADRARQEAAPVPGMEEARAREAADAAQRTQPYMDEAKQGLIDDTDQGYFANQYGGGQGLGRIDENGIPIRADRSMEAQNLTDPLQRNLWGDELPRQSAQEAPYGITRAMDRMQPEARAEAIKSQFPNSQRGALNIDMFDPLFKVGKVLADGTRLLLVGSHDGPQVAAFDKNGKKIAEAGFSQKQWARPPSEHDNLSAGWVTTDQNLLMGRGPGAEFGERAPAPRKGLATEMYKMVSEHGNDIEASRTQTPEGQAMWNRWEQNGLAKNGRIPANQRGAIDYQAVHDTIQKVLNKANKAIETLESTKVSPYTDKEKVVLDSLGKPQYIPKGDTPEAIVKAALAEGKDAPNVFQSMQSGLMSYGDKVGSAAAKGIARWLSYAHNMGERFYHNEVLPVEHGMARLSKNDLIASQEVLRKGMLEGKVYTDAQMQSAGLSPKAIESYHAMRKAFDDVWTNTNAAREQLGLEPIKKEDAYMASMWHGNWHVPILDKEGHLAWYLKVETKAEAIKAIKYLQKDPELAKTLNLDKPEIKYHPEPVGRKAPADVMGAYQEMLSHFDGDVAARVKEAFEAYSQEKGYKFQYHDKHFENKSRIRGFQGDRPWLSDHENAVTQAKAQIQYLKQAYRWAPMQEALANIKEVLANEELNKQQPNNMALSKAYTAQALGMSKNMFKEVEQAMNKMMTGMPGWMKPVDAVTPRSVSSFVGSMKHMTYLTQLGMSMGYAIATPLQAFLLGPARHMKLSGEGYKYNMLTTSAKALYDFSLGLMGHSVKNTLHTKYDMPMSTLGKAAFKYMEDSGIISQNIFHENSGLGENGMLSRIGKGIGLTISYPEKIARAATFMSFVHHLDESGKFTTQGELFRRAEELTNHTLTDFRRISRPLAVDRFGQAGEMMYVYKSPVFNQYNSLGEFARDAIKGKPGPLLAALGMTAVLGGLTGMPGMDIADDAFNLLKKGVAHFAPQHYPAWSGLGVKGTIISKSNEVAKNKAVQAAIGEGPAKFIGDTGAYGAVSAATGSQMASRFSSQIGDITNPLNNAAPAIQEGKEMLGIGLSALNPTAATIEQAIHDAVAPPAVKGWMENYFDNFKTVKRKDGQGYAAPSHISDHSMSYVRNKDEEMKRNLGLYSLDEATTKNNRFINNQEQTNFKTAQDSSIDKMFDALVNKRKDDAQMYAKSYFRNNGENFEAELDKKINAYVFTPEERMAMRDNILSQLGVKRLQKLQGRR